MKTFCVAALASILIAGAAAAQTNSSGTTTPQSAPYASGQPAPAGVPVGPTGSIKRDATNPKGAGAGGGDNSNGTGGSTGKQ